MIRLTRITRHNDGVQAAVLDALDVTFATGKISAILGASGVGKSTLLNVLLMVEKAESGTIEINGKTVTSDRIDPTLISGMLQSTALFQHLTVLENLTLAPRLVLKQSAEVANQNAMEWLKKLGVEGKANSYPHQLSGGEVQRAGLARVLMMQPKILVLDEPTSALNEEWIGQLAVLLKDFSSNGGTVILTTHHLNFAERIADERFVLEDGKLKVIDQIPEQLLNAQTDAAGDVSGLDMQKLGKKFSAGRRYVRLYR